LWTIDVSEEHYHHVKSVLSEAIVNGEQKKKGGKKKIGRSPGEELNVLDIP